MTVRFPTGVSVTYNDAGYVIWNVEGSHRLYTQKDGQLIALVPCSAVVELRSPCKFENPIQGHTVESAARLLSDKDNRIRTAPPFLLAQIKKLLRKFDATQMAWRKP